MAELLFLAHRIPYPPDKGDKIRSWHILAHLLDRFDVHLGCLVDDPADWAHVGHLRGLCASCHFAALDPRLARLRSLAGLVTGEALTFPYFRRPDLQRWVADTRARPGIAVEFAFSSGVAPYLGPRRTDRLRVIDFVDVDSAKWDQYAARKPWPLKALYAREARLLRRAERSLAADADAALFVSDAEARLFRETVGPTAATVVGLSNGVDPDYFDPRAAGESPYPPGGPVVVFTGMMDYWANVDAVRWFAADVWPRVKAAEPGSRFWIVGARPTSDVKRLAADPGITVTGRVPDVRPYLAHARLAVAPLRIARGIQNKVLEAMAMAKPVVATAGAFEGIDARAESDLLVRGEPAAYADAVVGLVRNPALAERIGQSARARVRADYGWPTRLAALDAVLGMTGADRRLNAAGPRR